MTKKKKTNREIIVHKTQHRKLKTEQHEPNQKLGVISGASGGGGGVISSCSTRGTRRDAHVIKNPVRV